jgi:hypothetical protein
MQITKKGAIAKQYMNTMIVALNGLCVADIPTMYRQEMPRKPGPWMRGRKPRRRKFRKKKRR